MYLKFCGKEKYISKVKKLVSDAPSISKGASEKQGGEEPPSKKLKQNENENSEKSLNEGPNCKSPNVNEKIWLRARGCFMTTSDQSILLNGDLLNDRHIDFAQRILLDMFPTTSGLKCTLLQDKIQIKKIEQGLQIIHHWILASTLQCTGNVVKIYDSIYCTVNDKTTDIIVLPWIRNTSGYFKLDSAFIATP